MTNPINSSYRALGYKADRDWSTWFKDFGNWQAWKEWGSAVKNLFSCCWRPQSPINKEITASRSFQSIPSSSNPNLILTHSGSSNSVLDLDDFDFSLEEQTPIANEGASSLILASRSVATPPYAGAHQEGENPWGYYWDTHTDSPIDPADSASDLAPVKLFPSPSRSNEAIAERVSQAALEHLGGHRDPSYTSFATSTPSSSAELKSMAVAKSASQERLETALFLERKKYSPGKEKTGSLEGWLDTLFRPAPFTALILEEGRRYAFPETSDDVSFKVCLKSFRETIAMEVTGEFSDETLNRAFSIMTRPWPKAALNSLQLQLNSWEEGTSFARQIDLDMQAIKKPKHPNEYESGVRRGVNKLGGVTNYFDVISQGNLPFHAYTRFIYRDGEPVPVSVIRQGVPTVEGIDDAEEIENSAGVQEKAIAVGGRAVSAIADLGIGLAGGIKIIADGIATGEGAKATVTKLGKHTAQRATRLIQGTVQIAPEYIAFIEKCKSEHKGILYCCLLNPELPDEKPRIEKLLALQEEYQDTFHFARFPLDGPLHHLKHFSSYTKYISKVLTSMRAAFKSPTNLDGDFIFSAHIIKILQQDNFYINAARWASSQINKVQQNYLLKKLPAGLTPDEQMKAFMMLYSLILKDKILSTLPIHFYNNTCKDGIDRGSAHLTADLLWHSHLNGSYQVQKEMIRHLAHLPAYMAKTQAMVAERTEWLKAFAKFLEYSDTARLAQSYRDTLSIELVELTPNTQEVPEESRVDKLQKVGAESRVSSIEDIDEL